MFGWKRKQSASDAEIVSVGIAVGDESVTLVALDGELEGRPNVIAWESIPFGSYGELQKGLERFVDDHDLKGRRCRCALPPSAYSLRLVERPENVPDDELADATRWLIRDLIEFDVDAAPLAVITIPGDSARMRTPHMFVVAAQHQVSLDLGQIIESAGLTLAGFEIDESAMLALDALMPTNIAGCAAIRLADKSSVLTLSHGNHLYLARNLHTDLYAIDAAADQALREENPAGASIIESLDPLLLDIQRSFDYYESEYGKAPPSRLTLLPGSVDMTPLVPALSEALRPVQVEPFDLDRVFAFPEAPPADLHLMLSMALGTAIAPADLIGDSLVPSILRKSAGGFGLSSVARIATAMVVVLAAYYGLAVYQLAHKNQVLAGLEARQTALSEAIDAHLEQAALKAMTADPEEELMALAAQRDARLSMLRDMTQQSSRSNTSFSNLLTGLARQDQNGIWLERIEFRNGGDAIALEGRTLEADELPTYLRQLGTEPGFGHRSFRRFELSRTDATEPGLRFKIATLGEEADAAGERP